LNLPTPELYRAELASNGASYPLNALTIPAAGLLEALPATPHKTGWPWTEQTSPSVYQNKKSWPKLSIVVPSFNQGSYLEETLRSILLQNYPNLELIVMDGGSTDDTLTVLEQYAKWISYYQSKKDKGQAQAINMGFSLASGDYYAWINSDDYYLKDTFHLVATKFAATKTDFVYGYAQDYNQATHQYTTIAIPPILDYFIKIPTLMQPSCFWRAGIHKPLWEELHCAIDYELWLRLLKGSSRSRIRKPLSVARTHSDAKSHDPKIKERWHQDHLRMWSNDGHGPVPEWNRIVFLNKIMMKMYKVLKVI
jgi:glycosyltransferase involved in cell wall biosynthesis